MIAATATAVAAVGAFGLGLMRVRPMIYGEAEVLFEASRMRGGLPLFVDPTAGAFDYGPVPTRCQVAYPPLWSWALSHVPAGGAETIGRTLATAAWIGGLAWIASRARPGLRARAAAAAGLAAGVFVTAIFATSARPDSVAVAIAGAALVRTLRAPRLPEQGVGSRAPRLDALAGAMLALAAWTKPNVLGVAAGLFTWTALRRPRDLGGALLGALAVSAPIAAVLHVVSHGTWWQHIVRTLGQPLALDVWWSHVGTRGMFVLPAAYVTWIALRSRRDAAAEAALFAWSASLAWALVSLGKIGSASNYWMEPAVAAVAVAGVAAPPAARRSARDRAPRSRRRRQRMDRRRERGGRTRVVRP